MDNVTLISASITGVVSFVSPCVLPLVPAVSSFISGVSVGLMVMTNQFSRLASYLSWLCLPIDFCRETLLGSVNK